MVHSRARLFIELDEFITAARLLNFRAAADELEIDSGVLSRRIARLERRLGVRLFHRTTRRVVLTEAGERLLPHAEALIAQLLDAEADLSQSANRVSGRLRISVPAAFGLRRIAPLIPEFLARYPDIELDLRFDDKMADLVRDGLDAAIRIGALHAGGDLKVRRIFRVRRFLAATPRYLAASPPLQQPADLGQHRLLHFTPLLHGPCWVLDGAAGPVNVPIRPSFASDNVEMLRIAALADQGVGYLTDFVASADLAAGKLVRVLPEWTIPEASVSVVYPNAPFVSARVRAFIDYLADCFTKADSCGDSSRLNPGP